MAARWIAVVLLATVASLAAEGLERYPTSTVDTSYGFHLAFGNGGVQNGVRCLWATARNYTATAGNGTATCSFGTTPSSLEHAASGRSYSYTAGNFTGSLHDVRMPIGLITPMPKPGTRIFYRCGVSGGDWSATYNFTIQSENVTSTNETDVADQPWIGVVCDMGMDHSEHTIASISEQVQASAVQMVVHGGDISYANDYKPATSNAYVWQTYFDEVSHFAAYVPYMTSPGNHESQFSFAAYLNWLPMPNISGSPFYHSFDYMGIHFTMISTEHNFSNGSAQQQWIIEDLKKAAANRKNVPWIVVVGHRPLYCTDLVLLKRCNEEAPVFRSYLEWILNMFKVDVYISGHNHQYERSFPVYHLKATQKDYIDPKAPVYIVDGAAGCKEAIDPTFLPSELAPWRAKHSDWFGTSWLRMRASLRILQFQLISSEENKVIDEFDITRTVAVY